MTEVAAASPHAWFPVARSAEEIADRDAGQPDGGLPLHQAHDVHHGRGHGGRTAAGHSAEKADALGVPEDQRVYLRGWGYAEDPVHVAGHPELWRSPAMAAASSTALAGAGIGIDDVAHFDLYSCFASSICFALDGLGMAEDDERA